MVIHAPTGEQLYHHRFITTPALTAERVTPLAPAGRGRWKIANENNNVLTTKGDHSEQNCGHGQQSLAACMRSLNLRAFLFHPVLAWCEAKYALLRQALVRRQTFFDDVRALTRYLVFESWHHWMDFMLRGLKLQPERDTG
jgi:hypothetical protein